MTRTKS